MNLLVNMSGVYADEGWADGIEIDLSGLEGTNAYCDDDAAAAIESALAPYPLCGIHWIDTGDYHYLSEIFLRKVSAPFSLAIFDHHSDEQPTAFGGGILSCGSWVSVLKENNPFFREPGPGIPVYVSIDLDVLSPDYARTNWDQGEMTLDGLLSAVRGIARSSRIIGIDVCGGLTIAKGASPADLSLNLRTRERLLSELTVFLAD